MSRAHCVGASATREHAQDRAAEWRISIVSASNNEVVLRSCLLASPGLVGAHEVIVERDAPSAAAAYNAALVRATGDVVVFAHQDVYLPPGWLETLRQVADVLTATDPRWAVAGVFGIGLDGCGKGLVYSTGLASVVGTSLNMPVEVQSLDEVILVLRRSAGLRFDDRLPGFHLYGTDICLTARQAGWSAYAFENLCVHNSDGIVLLPLAYWRAWLYMRKKWWTVLPVTTPCSAITRLGRPVVRYCLEAVGGLLFKKQEPGRRADDPARVLACLRSERAGDREFTRAPEGAPSAWRRDS